MQLTVLILAGALFLTSVVTAALYYPVKVKLTLFDGDFSAKLSYLFYKVTLTDSRFPVDIRDYTRRKWKKELRRLAREKKRKTYRGRKKSAAPKNPVLRSFFYLRLVTRIVRALGAENVPRLSVHIYSLRMAYGTGSPPSTAVLHGAVAGGLSNLFTFLSGFSHFRMKKDALLLTPDFFTATYRLSFSVALRMPLIYYLSVFHTLVPDSERVLHVLAKRKEKLDRKRRASGRKRGFPKWQKTVYPK